MVCRKKKVVKGRSLVKRIAWTPEQQDVICAHLDLMIAEANIALGRFSLTGNPVLDRWARASAVHWRSVIAGLQYAKVRARRRFRIVKEST